MDRTLFLPILILILLVVLFVLVALNKKRFNVRKREDVLKNLFALRSLAESDDVSVRRDTVIKLDNLLSKVLQMYYGNNLACGENLKVAKNIFKKKSYNSLWDAHKLRNKVVHNDYEVSKEEAKQAFEVYKLSIVKVLE